MKDGSDGREAASPSLFQAQDRSERGVTHSLVYAQSLEEEPHRHAQNKIANLTNRHKKRLLFNPKNNLF